MFLNTIFIYWLFCLVLEWCAALSVRWTRTIWHGYLDQLLWDMGSLSQLHQPLWETPTLNQRFYPYRWHIWKVLSQQKYGKASASAAGHVPPAVPSRVVLEKCPHWSSSFLYHHHRGLQPRCGTWFVYVTFLNFFVELPLEFAAHYSISCQQHPLIFHIPGRLFKPLTSPELNSYYKSTSRGYLRGRIRNMGPAVNNT